MNEEPKSIWKKSWKGRYWLRAWLVVVVVTFFIALIVYLSGNIPGGPPSLWPELFFLLTGSLITATVFVGLWAFIRWLCRWRNFKRFLFGLACFVTLIALFYAEEDWRGKHDWDQFKRQWEAKGEKFDFASVVPPPVPDDQNFALTPIVASSWEAQLDKNGRPIQPPNTNVVDRMAMSFYGNDDLVKWPSDGLGNWQKAETSDLKVWQQYYRALAAKTNLFPVAPQPQTPAQDVLLALSKYDPAIQELREASKLPYSRFPLDYDRKDVWAILLPHLGDLKRCSQVLQLRAIAELQNGQSDKALDDVKLMLRLTDSIHTEPFLISHLVRIAISQITLQPIYEGLAEHKWSDAQLAELDSGLAKLDFLVDYERSMRGERGCDIGAIEFLRHRNIRNFREILGLTGENFHITLSLITLLYYLSPDGWFYQTELQVCQFYAKWYLPAVDDKAETVSVATVNAAGAALEIELKHRTPESLLEKCVLASLGAAVKRFAYAQESVDLARVAIALERYRLAHGEYPKLLDALTPQFMEKIPHDIINGEPLQYRRTAGGQFVLYSVGWNEADDDGEVGLTKGGTVDRDTGDWVWRYPSK